jgi:hypothetical protein
MGESGSLTRVAILPPEDIEQGQRALSVSQEVMNSMSQLGFSQSAPPNNYRGEMPDDITRLDGSGVIDLLNKISRWCEYIEDQIALARVRMNESESALEFVKARIRIGLRVSELGKLTVQDKNDMVTTDPRVVAATRAYTYHMSFYEMLKSLSISTQRNWDTVSRRLTQLGFDINRQVREHNMGNIPSRTFNRPPNPNQWNGG